jgi:hypothetical protein
MCFVCVLSGLFCLGNTIDLQRAVEDRTDVNGRYHHRPQTGSRQSLSSAGRCDSWIVGGYISQFKLWM